MTVKLSDFPLPRCPSHSSPTPAPIICPLGLGNPGSISETLVPHRSPLGAAMGLGAPARFTALQPLNC